MYAGGKAEEVMGQAIKVRAQRIDVNIWYACTEVDAIHAQNHLSGQETSSIRSCTMQKLVVVSLQLHSVPYQSDPTAKCLLSDNLLAGIGMEAQRCCAEHEDLLGGVWTKRQGPVKEAHH